MSDQDTQLKSKDIKKTTLLLVEDDPVITKMYTTRFQSAGFEVISADNGVDGLRLALEKNISIILLDMLMPQMSGLDFLQKLSENETKRNTPVVVLSNVSDKGEIEKAKSFGVKEYLPKSTITPSDIIEILKKYI